MADIIPKSAQYRWLVFEKVLLSCYYHNILDISGSKGFKDI